MGSNHSFEGWILKQLMLIGNSGKANWSWQNLFDGVKMGARIIVPLGMLYIGSRILRRGDISNDLDGLDLFSPSGKNKSKRKPKYELKVQPLEETISSYHDSLLNARVAVDTLNNPMWKKSLKLKQMRKSMSGNCVRISILLKSITFD